MLNKKHSKGFFIRLISGITLAVVAIVTTLSVMLPSYAKWKTYYDTLMAEKKKKEYLNSLPLEFLGITAELSETVKYYDNDTADPEPSDFVVKANFTEKGRDFSKKLSIKDFTMTVPEDFAKNGGTIVFSYTYQPEDTKNDKGEMITPDPIEKTTELNLSLIAPDESVFKVVKEPTFFEAGYAENIKGTKKELPALNLTDYTTKTYSDQLVKFTHNESGIVVKKYVTDNISVVVAGSEKQYNNIDCHFVRDVENLKISFLDGTFIFEIKDETSVSLGKIVSKSAVEFATGVVNVEGNVSVKNFVVKSGATVNIVGLISVTDMLVENGSTLNVTASGDTLKVADDGVLQLYGTVNITSKTKGKSTAIYLRNNSSCVLSSDSRVTVTDYEYAIGKWVGNNSPDGRKGNLCIPRASQINDKCIQQDGVNLVDASTCKLFYSAENIRTLVSDLYTIVTPPTATSTGLANGAFKGDYVLPKLNFSDYYAEISGTKLTFIHNDTGLIFDLSFDKVSNLKIDCLTIDYSEETGYKFTVDEGNKVELEGGFTTEKLTVAGKGELAVKGKITIAECLTIEENASLTITPSSGDALQLSKDKKAGAIAKLYGTLTINSVSKKTGIWCGISTAIYLKDTSRIVVNGTPTYGIFAVNGSEGTVKCYYPTGAKKNANNVTSASGDILLSWTGTVLRVDFIEQTEND